MNVRLDSGSIRVRISPEQAKALLAGDRLVMSLLIASDEAWELELEVGPRPDLFAALTPTGLRLQIPVEGMRNALSTYPSKQAGVYGTQSRAGHEVQLAVEIDVKRPRGSRKPAEQS